MFHNHFIDPPPKNDNHGVVGDRVGLRLQFAELDRHSSTHSTPTSSGRTAAAATDKCNNELS